MIAGRLDGAADSTGRNERSPSNVPQGASYVATTEKSRPSDPWGRVRKDVLLQFYRVIPPFAESFSVVNLHTPVLDVPNWHRFVFDAKYRWVPS